MNDQEKKYLKIGGITIGLWLAYKLIFEKKIDNQGVYVDPTGNGSSTGNGGVTPYIFNANSVANALWVAMKDMGTWSFCDKGCEDDIFEALKPVNAQQFTAVFNAFGKRKYNNATGNNYEVWGFPIDSYDLKHWLKKELSAQKYNTLRLKYPGQL